MWILLASRQKWTCCFRNLFLLNCLERRSDNDRCNDHVYVRLFQVCNQLLTREWCISIHVNVFIWAIVQPCTYMCLKYVVVQSIIIYSFICLIDYLNFHVNIRLTMNHSEVSCQIDLFSSLHFFLVLTKEFFRFCWFVQWKCNV
jgi:hypothetical protein